MHVSSLYLHRFRPFEEMRLDFTPRLNVIVGANAIGKTSILEAIYFLVSGRSFRASRLLDLVKKGSEAFFIEGHYHKHEIQRQIRIFWGEKEKKILCDQTICTGLSILPGLLPGVIMAPDDIALIKGTPQERRDYLDGQLAQVDPLYLHHHSRYHRAMRQRNVLLRARQTLTLDAWEHEMAQSASYLTLQRLFAVKDLRSICQKYFSLLGSAQETLEVHFKVESLDAQNLKTYYLESYRKNRFREMELGATLVGPHKDDLTLLINGQDARYFASEGQQRTCVAALRFAEWERLKSLCDEDPLMLIDDIGASLDQTRQQKLWELIDTLGQVIVTTNEIKRRESVINIITP